MNRFTLCLLAFVLLAPVAARATPITVPINQSQSSITVQLCILSGCDTDVSPVNGFASIKLAPTISPTALTLYDFHAVVVEPINLDISFGIFGAFHGIGNNLIIDYATPGAPLLPPVVVFGAGAFNLANVPTLQQGTVTYTSTGIVCSALTGAGLPCNGVNNLADQGVTTGSIGGTVSVSPARVVTLLMQPNVVSQIDPNNPGTAVLTTTGTIRGTATIPLRGDANLDGVRNGKDVQSFLSVMLNPAAQTWQKRFAVDMNDDDVFDSADITLFANCLVYGGCPG